MGLVREARSRGVVRRGIVLQAVISWTAEDGSSVHRVVTRRLQVAATPSALLRAMDCEVAALLLAKRVVQEARQADAASHAREAEKLRRAIGEHPPIIEGAAGATKPPLSACISTISWQLIELAASLAALPPLHEPHHPVHPPQPGFPISSVVVQSNLT